MHVCSLRVPLEVATGDWIIFTPHGENVRLSLLETPIDARLCAQFKYDGRDCVVTKAELIQAKIDSAAGEFNPLNVKPMNDRSAGPCFSMNSNFLS